MFILLFAIGACVGSFLNVVIDRMPRAISILHGRSHCEFCKKNLAWYDLFPLFSFLFLFGKCRYCHHALSLQYPIIEFVTGLLFISVYLIETPVSAMAFLLFIIDIFLVTLGLALTVMDIKYHLLLDSLLVPFFLFSFVRVVMTQPSLLPLHFLVGFFGAVPLLLIYMFTSGKGMGFGDVKLIFILGFLLLFPKILIIYYVAFLTGAAAGIILVLGGKKRFKDGIIAFGPFLLLGALCATLWGNLLWQYVQTVFGF